MEKHTERIAFVASIFNETNTIKSQLISNGVTIVDVFEYGSDPGKEYKIIEYNVRPNKEFAEILDLSKCVSTHGFHNSVYTPPIRNGMDPDADKAKIFKIKEDQGMPNLQLALESNNPEEIDINKYELIIEEIHKREQQLLEKEQDITTWTIKELAALYETTSSFKVVLDLAIEISFRKFGDPISKKGYKHKYNPEWMQEGLQEILDKYPEKKRPWLKAYKTRLRKIIKGEVTDKLTGARKNLYSIKGFIDFLARNYAEEIAPVYQQGTDDVESYTGVRNNIPTIDIDEDMIPF